MAWQKEHKQHSKDKILLSAAKLFTQNGFANVSIDQIMQDAQLTRGAFYAHFNSKSDLYSQAIIKAALSAQKTQQQQCCSDNLLTLAKSYLSNDHAHNNSGITCPLAALVTDIAQQNETVKATYTEVFEGFVGSINNKVAGNNIAALQSAVLMIGGLALAKALNNSELSEQLLVACHQAIADILPS